MPDLATEIARLLTPKGIARLAPEQRRGRHLALSRLPGRPAGGGAGLAAIPERHRRASRSTAQVVQLLAREGVADRLLAEHDDDGTGHCIVCSAGGRTGRIPWPCHIARAASKAQVINWYSR